MDHWKYIYYNHLQMKEILRLIHLERVWSTTLLLWLPGPPESVWLYLLCPHYESKRFFENYEYRFGTLGIIYFYENYEILSLHAVKK